MRHEDRQTLPPQPDSAGLARGFVHRLCGDWGIGATVCDTAVLLTSELVTNGILHARTPVAVTAKVDDDSLCIAVVDDDPRPPVRRSQRADLLADIDELLGRDLGTPEPDERDARMHVGPAGSIGTGRGLLLVEALADEWGVTMQADGKAVWFRLAVTQGPPDS